MGIVKFLEERGKMLEKTIEQSPHEFMQQELSPSQIDYLIQFLRTQPEVIKEFDLSNWDECYENFKWMSEREKKRIFALVYNKKWKEVGEVLRYFNIPFKVVIH